MGKYNALNWTGRRQSRLLLPWLQASQGAPLHPQGPGAPCSAGGRRSRMQEMGSVLGHCQCPWGGTGGVSSRSSLPWPSCFSPNGPHTPFPPAAVKKKKKMVFLFLPLPVKTPAAELQAWPAATSSSRTQGLCRALGEPWPLWLEQDSRVWWQRCTSFRVWCRGWVLLNAALLFLNTPSIAKITCTTQVHQCFQAVSSPASKSITLLRPQVSASHLRSLWPVSGS